MATKQTAPAAVAPKQTFSMALTAQLDGAQNALPVGFNKARFVQNALALLNDNPDIGKFGQQQIMAGLMKGAVLGLDFFTREAFLVPYGNKLQYQTSYTGSIKLAKKYSIRPIKNIYAKLVRDGDSFEEIITNGDQTLNFRPKPFNKGKVVGAFAVCQFEDGGIQYDTMSIDELENTRKHSKASNSPAWNGFTGEMYKKTVLKRLCKHIEIDFENAEQLRVYEEDTAVETDPRVVSARDIEENANTVSFEDAIDAEVVETKPDPDDLPEFLQREEVKS